MESFPNADLSQFHVYPKVVLFVHGHSYEVFLHGTSGPIHKYPGKLGQLMEKALGVNFPKAYQQGPTNYIKGWNTAVGDMGLVTHLTINTPKPFSVSLPNLFRWYDTTTGKKAHAFLAGPDFDFWAQQLNFVVWCATTGCGVGYDMLKDPTVGFVFRFHVAFTMRRLLYEMGIPLPDSKGFKDYPNDYNKKAHSRLVSEFGAGNDYRIGKGNNDGLGFLYHFKRGAVRETDYTQYPGMYKFKDEGGDVLYAHNYKEDTQWRYFVLPEGKGLTQAGVARINRSIEALVYCVLGAQANTRSPIVGSSGSAMETQQEFLVLFKSAVIENDIAKSIQRYQFATSEAKKKLDFAAALGCWLLPSDLVINDTSVMGYNNKLQKVTTDMKLGVNNINMARNVKIPHFVRPPKKTLITPPKRKVTPPKKESHSFLKIGVSAVAMGVGYYLFR